MLWTLLDIAVFIGALLLVVVLFPGGAARAWRRGLLERSRDRSRPDADVGADRSSTK